jgi:threonine aldolase
MRYVSAQLLAFLKDDLWLRNAQHANDMAQAVARILAHVPGIRLAHPVQTNQVFADIDPQVTALLETSGFRFRAWDHRDPTRHRLVMSFQDDAHKVERVRAALAVCVASRPHMPR